MMLMIIKKGSIYFKKLRHNEKFCNSDRPITPITKDQIPITDISKYQIVDTKIPKASDWIKFVFDLKTAKPNKHKQGI